MENTIAISVVSKRRESSAVLAVAGETIIDVDRANPVLGNKHILRTHRDDREWAAVIEAHRRDFDADVARCGPMSRAIDDIIARLKRGERIALRCWCAPRLCHGDTYVAEIKKRMADARPIKCDAPA